MLHPQKEDEEALLSILTIVSPGTSLRAAIDDIAKGRLGALIVVGNPPEVIELINGGFEVNCKFSPQKLVELCKMDGAIIVDSELKKILHSNTQLIPNPKIETTETGTRHKAAERTAKQVDQLVIAVSERKGSITLYKGKTKYVLRSTQDLLNRSGETLRMLENHKDIYHELMLNLNVLEFTSLASLNDAVLAIQKAEIIERIEQIVRRYIIELGVEGALIEMQLKEIIKGISKEELLIVKDYSLKDELSTKVELSQLSLEKLIDTSNILKVLGYDKLEEVVEVEGHRILSKIPISKEKISLLVTHLGNLQSIISLSEADISEYLGDEAAKAFMEGLSNLKEQVMLGKKI
ncbi:MAG: DNA integrity scanning diadenylate cyclase DisA [Nanoarchaeota archaeon]|nr:DNA integrity scanning diadenylate cyclase DisA [Nanoarchaeota archaeon]